MSNKIDLSTCDAFELTEIAYETLTAAAGYFYQMILIEQNKIKSNNLLLKEYFAQHSRIIAVLLNSNHALLKEKLIEQINHFSIYSTQLKELSFLK